MKLKRWLFDNEILVTEFAKMINYDRAYVQAWLSGLRTPSKRALATVREMTDGKVRCFEDLIGK
jgi:hypothetical protein